MHTIENAKKESHALITTQKDYLRTKTKIIRETKSEQEATIESAIATIESAKSLIIRQAQQN